MTTVGGTPANLGSTGTPANTGSVSINSTKTNETKETKELGLGKPTVFSGDKEKVKKFIQDNQLYLRNNKPHYDTDEKKILFMLSRIDGGTADAWKESWLDTYLGQDDWGTFTDFINAFEKAFKAIDSPGDAFIKIKTEDMGRDETVEQHNHRFNIWKKNSNITDDMVLIYKYSQRIPKSLRDKVLNCENPPTTIQGFMDTAVKFDNNYRKAQSLTKYLQTHTHQKNPRRTEHRPRTGSHFSPQYTPPSRSDDAMDVDRNRLQNNRLSVDEQNRYHQEGRCFRCHQKGHISRECPQNQNHNQYSPSTSQNQQSSTPKKSTRQTVLELKAIIQGLDEEEQKAFYTSLEKEDF
jgi:hypothetical protein